MDKRELKDILDIMRDSRRLQQDQDRGSIVGGVALPHPPTLPLAVPYGSAYTYAAPLPLYVPVAYQKRGGGGGAGAGVDQAALYDKANL